jgi:hypothetical protein
MAQLRQTAVRKAASKAISRPGFSSTFEERAAWFQRFEQRSAPSVVHKKHQSVDVVLTGDPSRFKRLKSI